MKPTDEHLTDEDIFGVPGYDEDPEGREEIMKQLGLYVNDPDTWTLPQLLTEIETLTSVIYQNWLAFPGSTLEKGMILAHIASILTLKLYEELVRAKLEGR